jgi:hypothetical protein
MTTKITRINADGTIETTTTDTRTPEQKLNGKLTTKEKLDLMYPTNPVDVTAHWESFDDHKRLK